MEMEAPFDGLLVMWYMILFALVYVAKTLRDSGLKLSDGVAIFVRL